MKLHAMLLAGAFALPALGADDPAAASFAWRATLDTSGQSGLVRLPLPAEALARLQTRNAADLRVFDASGAPVAFAFATPPQPSAAPRQETGAFRALPLYAAPAGAAAPKGTLQMRVQQDGQQQSVWVQLGEGNSGATKPAAQRLPAVLFDTRAQKDAVSGFVVRAQLPANVPVAVTLSTSPDLASWTPLPVRGRLYRFEGEGAPVNDQLELSAPVQLQDRYLRLEWAGQEGIAVESVAGLLAAALAQREQPALTLPAGIADGPNAVEWQLGFATPIARVELTTARDNTLLPVRILGRNEASEPWRLLANTLVYRLGAAGQESTNPAAVLYQPSARWLRVEATHGTRLEGVPLTARVRFEPVEVVFAAGSAGPYQVVAGRGATPPAALPIAMLASATTVKVENLPAARIVATQVDAGPATGWWTPWLPRGVDNKTAGLWAVLLAGVLLLGAVAWSLLRQVNAKPGT
ncbi:MAG TPA: DUF3999 family protein [Ramlibacter sp.]|uniref:DUF3999 family protein n=1 Tax=Ramlibacter sp. TaxID=1917967 RepID=UPI002ED4BCCB